MRYFNTLKLMSWFITTDFLHTVFTCLPNCLLCSGYMRGYVEAPAHTTSQLDVVLVCLF